MLVAVDFETYYDKEHTITNGTVAYLFDPRFYAYLVTWSAEDGRTGHCFLEPGRPPPPPELLDLLDQNTVVMHNASFDLAVWRRLGWPEVWADLVDTADLAAWCGSERSLLDAGRSLLGVQLDKTVRASMSGRTVRSLSEMEQRALVEYAERDSRVAMQLAAKYLRSWPLHERRLSRWTLETGFRGLHIDQERLDAFLRRLAQIKFEAEASLPWDWEEGKTPLSLMKLREACVQAGIPCPGSFSEDNEDCLRWEEQYADKYPWIRAIRTWRKANMIEQRLLAIRRNINPQTNRFQFTWKYFGSHTGRWAGGGGGLNVLAMDKRGFEGVCTQHVIAAPPGKVLIECDAAQIEPRVLLWSAGDRRQLDLIRGGMNIYEAHARASMQWTGGKLKTEAPDLYRLAKARVLGLGYGCGVSKFISVARAMAGIELTQEEAAEAVSDYRVTNRSIVDFWRKLERWVLYAAIRSEPVAKIQLPSGRELRYFWPAYSNHELTAYPRLGGPRKTLHGGLLTENFVQAVSRDALAWWVCLLLDAGLDVRLAIHDSVIVEVDEKDASDAVREVERCLTTPPEWAKDLPLACESKVSAYLAAGDERDG